jgi:hypothetical protein
MRLIFLVSSWKMFSMDLEDWIYQLKDLSMKDNSKMEIKMDGVFKIGLMALLTKEIGF